MTIAVRYQSRGGNTKTVAEAIAKVANVQAEPISAPVTEHTDILFVGGGVYQWGIDKTLIDFLKSLEPNLIKMVAVFCTSGGMNKTKDIKAIVQEKEIAVSDEALSFKFGVKNHALFSKKSLVLDEKRLQAINTFVQSVIKA